MMIMELHMTMILRQLLGQIPKVMASYYSERKQAGCLMLDSVMVQVTVTKKVWGNTQIPGMLPEVSSSYGSVAIKY